MKNAASSAGEEPRQPDEGGIFLFGMERSGTTLLSMIVGSHPDIAVPLATAGLWYDVADRRGFHAPGSEVDQVTLVQELLEHERIRRWDCELTSDDVLPLCRGGDYPSLIAAFHQAYANAQGKPTWANLDIATLDRLHTMNDWFPNARFVHIYRDARDVAISHQTMPYGSGNLAECADAWSRRLTVNLRMGQILGPKRYMTISYEKLVNDPEPVLRELCRFLGVSFSTEMLSYAEMADAKIPHDRRWLWPNLVGPLDQKAAHRWRRAMSMTRRIVVERYAGGLLKELGYETLEPLPRRLGAEALDLACFLDRGGRTKRTLQKFGLRRPSLLERRWRDRPENARS